MECLKSLLSCWFSNLSPFIWKIFLFLWAHAYGAGQAEEELHPWGLEWWSSRRLWAAEPEYRKLSSGKAARPPKRGAFSPAPSTALHLALASSTQWFSFISWFLLFYSEAFPFALKIGPSDPVETKLLLVPRGGRSGLRKLPAQANGILSRRKTCSWAAPQFSFPSWLLLLPAASSEQVSPNNFGRDSMAKILSHPGSFSDLLKSHFSWFRTRSLYHYQIFASFKWSAINIRKYNWIKHKHEKLCRNLSTVLRVDCTKKS